MADGFVEGGKTQKRRSSAACTESKSVNRMVNFCHQVPNLESKSRIRRYKHNHNCILSVKLTQLFTFELACLRKLNCSLCHVLNCRFFDFYLGRSLMSGLCFGWYSLLLMSHGKFWVFEPFDSTFLNMGGLLDIDSSLTMLAETAQFLHLVYAWRVRASCIKKQPPLVRWWVYSVEMGSKYIISLFFFRLLWKPSSNSVPSCGIVFLIWPTRMGWQIPTPAWPYSRKRAKFVSGPHLQCSPFKTRHHDTSVIYE